MWWFSVLLLSAICCCYCGQLCHWCAAYWQFLCCFFQRRRRLRCVRTRLSIDMFIFEQLPMKKYQNVGINRRIHLTARLCKWTLLLFKWAEKNYLHRRVRNIEKEEVAAEEGLKESDWWHQMNESKKFIHRDTDRERDRTRELWVRERERTKYYLKRKNKQRNIDTKQQPTNRSTDTIRY